jgi:hypothetical protein
MQILREKMGKSEQLMAPVHPGEILREDFMKPLGLSVNKLALECMCRRRAWGVGIVDQEVKQVKRGKETRN